MKYLIAFMTVSLVVLGSCAQQGDNTTDTNSGNTLETNTDTMAEELTGSIVVDLNHPLAGETLTFEVELVGVTKAEWNTEVDTAEAGDEVQVHYVGTLADGSQFDSSRDRDATLDFTLWAGQMIPGFDTGVVGMTTGESKTLILAPEEAYGERDDTQTETIPKSELASFVNAGFSLEVGEKLPTQFGELTIIDVIEE